MRRNWLFSVWLAWASGCTGSVGALPTLTVSTVGSGLITSEPSGLQCGDDCSERYQPGATVQLTATPAAGWRFIGWNGGGCNALPTCTVKVDTDIAVQATFAQVTFTLSAQKTGQGTVTSTPQGIDCGSDCGEAFGEGTNVVLNAAPADRFEFVGWSGAGCSGNASCRVVMAANQAVSAEFRALPVGMAALSVQVEGGGRVTSNVGGIDCPQTDCTATLALDSEVTLTAVAQAGAVFSGWGGACSGSQTTCTVSLAASTVVTASFSSVTSPLRVTLAGSGTGRVTSAPLGIDCGGTCTASFDERTTVMLSAAPMSGSLFTGWSGDCTGPSTCSVTMGAPRAVTANFALGRTLTVAKAGAGAGTVTSAPAGIDCGADCSERYADGTSVTLTAAAAAGSTFTGWSGGGCSGTSTNCTLASLGAAATVTATFAGTTSGGLGLDARPNNTTCFAFDPPTSTTATLSLPRVFNGLSFSDPLALVQAPQDASRWFVVEKSGVVRVFANTESATSSSVFIDVTSRIATAGELEAGLLGLAFDPNFGVGAGKNQFFYLFYTGAPNSGYRLRSKISRFAADATATTASVSSEVNLLALDKFETNHNGGNLAFGPDGYLYAGFGEGGGDPNPQARDDHYLFGKIIRIDPHATTGSVPYAIPADNPHAGQPLCNATGRGGSTECPEVWARGFRNPWRWSFDRVSGRLWVGDVGWGSFEEVDIVVKNADYGWPTAEGPCTSNCTGLTDPVYAVPRGNGQSISGGFVYRGTQTTDLVGQYLFGDFGSKMFSAVVAGSTPGAYTTRELIAPYSTNSVMVSSFGEANDGELYVLDFAAGSIHHLVFSSGSGGSGPKVPTLLSQTGCAAVNPQTPSAGMVAYELNAPFWSDGAVKTRSLALPSTSALTSAADGDLTVPPRAVIRKDFRLQGQLIETRLLMRQSNGDWAGYSYEWNSAQTDATLVASTGKDVTLGTQTWSYPGRTQCLQCHTSAAGFSLGLELPQLNRSATYPQTGRSGNQLTTLSAASVAMLTPTVSDPNSVPTLTDPFGAGELGARARAWLHANCSMCHRPSGPTPVTLNFVWSASLSATNACDADPTSGGLGLSNPKIIAPGAPERSVLIARINSRDPKVQMPPLGSHQVDAEGVALLRDWVSSLTGCQ